MAEKLKRISVAVDSDTDRILRILAKKENKTISEIIRNAISVYSEFDKDKEKGVSPGKTKIYAELLAGREHVIVDIELWVAMLDELNETASEKFWEIVEKIGYEHGIQYRMKGLYSLQDVLTHMENENWFRVKADEGIYTLILSARSEQRILRTFFKGLLRALNIDAEMVEGLRKLIIVVNSDGHVKEEELVTSSSTS
ncbi:ribbon-helix-helix protein, CopG family [Archaeoglobus veneficus]|uniref:CopG-like domain-containing protein DNA-binding protein n=1 Tax=Archaeoglobus veneficus (strain DSM 11195 / SNP6) TaxID=693661 RepID=F2KN77_ARCVS|nr:ribbon-helix-helix protein, CopG family [Archaeoglobus veneficus]AEA46178.1 CopG-like domain-containing protein DNA-binding protein [Archaeoglobus veneficus SNP6]